MKTEVDHAFVSHLSDAAHRKSFDPWRDIDWSVPFDDTYFYLPPHLVSLYGTELWNSMTREQQVRLSMHEASSTLAKASGLKTFLASNWSTISIEPILKSRTSTGCCRRWPAEAAIP